MLIMEFAIGGPDGQISDNYPLSLSYSSRLSFHGKSGLFHFEKILDYFLFPVPI